MVAWGGIVLGGYQLMRVVWTSDWFLMCTDIVSARFAIDPITLIVVLVAVPALMFPWVMWIPFSIYIARAQPRRYVRVLHEALRTRGIYYCPNFKCRYNCTGIRGNTCPECGAQVPGHDREVD